jgi:hypothetical protein
MSARTSGLLRGLAPALLALGGLLSRRVDAQPAARGQAIVFSGPKGGELTNSLRQLTRKGDSLKQLEEDLHRPLGLFNGDDGGSLGGMLPEQPPASAEPAPQSRRAREMEDRRKNWVFMSPDEFVATAAKDRNPGTADEEYDQGGQSLTVLEKYFLGGGQAENAKKDVLKRSENLFQKWHGNDEMGRTAQDQENRADGMDDPSASEKALKKLLNSQPDAAAAARQGSVFGDIFGLNDNLPSQADMLEHKARMQEFRQILEPGWQPPSDAFGSFSNSFANAAPAGLGGLQASPNADQSDSGSDVAASLPGSLPKLNPVAAPLPSVTPALPKTQPVDLTPPTPNFLAPKRPF